MYKNKFTKFMKTKKDLSKNEDKRVLSFKEIKLQMNITVASIVMVVLITIGSSYAAFSWSNTSTVSQSVSTGTYNVNFTTNNTGITLSSAYPMSDSAGQSSSAYTFTIKNSGVEPAYFNLKLVNDTANGSTMDISNIKVYMTGSKVLNTTYMSYLPNNELDFGYLSPNETRTYNLRVWLKSDASNSAIGKTFVGKLTLDSNQLTKRNTTLSDAIKKDNTVSYTTPNFNSIATSDEGLKASADSDGTTYYFRGSVEDNYVKFANQKWANTDYFNDNNKTYGHGTGQDMLWRIVRINGDGTIRLIADGSVGDSAFNGTFTDAKYVGYTYDKSSTTAQDGTASTMKTYLENWYNSNMSSYDSYITTSRFCNDTSISSTSSYTYYSSYQRLYNSKSPSFKCGGDSPNFTQTYGGEYTNLKIGLITADEVAFAGGESGTYNQSYYLYGKSSYFWTMAPCKSSTQGYSFSFLVRSTGDLNDDYVSTNYAVRPVINVKADTLIKYGKGTKSDPYVIGTFSRNLPGCFLAGTKVKSIDGYKDIDKLKVGDMVLSYNEETNKVEYNQVVNTIEHDSSLRDIYKIKINGKIIEATWNHEFYIIRDNKKLWIQAKDIKESDMVMDSDLNYYPIEEIKIETLNTKTYNITVNGNHNYFVSDNNILVHNVVVTGT